MDEPVHFLSVEDFPTDNRSYSPKMTDKIIVSTPANRMVIESSNSAEVTG
ncbi:MAG: hypothetical protein ABR936_15240 [Bacteroidota bacterium]|jgi:hypothetical protein